MRLNTDIFSTAAAVDLWVKNLPRGTIFFMQDIKVEGSDAAIRKIASQLVKEKVILRLAKGIYIYPKEDSLLGTLKPSLEEVANAIARRDNIRLQPTSALALNKLGISTQIPMKQVYYTDGTQRSITIGKGTIIFKQRSPRRVAQKSYIVALIIAAIEELGIDGLTIEIKQKLKETLAKEEMKIIQEDSLTAPVWVRTIIKELIK
jgi:hypothetical protein